MQAMSEISASRHGERLPGGRRWGRAV